MSGAGKSVTVCDLLSQTEAFYDYTVIIEEGLSYEIYTRTVEPSARPIIIQPDGDLTINYLDTHGLPLTAEHLASAMALVAKIAGVSSDEDKQLSREAQIAKHIMLLYEDVFEEWSRRNSDQLLEIARHACALAKIKRSRPGTTLLDVFVDFRDLQRTNRDPFAAMVRWRQLWLPARWCEQHFPNRQDRALRTRIHSRRSEASARSSRISYH
jgi:hypothetical protein